MLKKALIFPTLLLSCTIAGITYGLLNKSKTEEKVNAQKLYEDSKNVAPFFNCIGQNSTSSNIDTSKVKSCREKLGFTWKWFDTQ